MYTQKNVTHLRIAADSALVATEVPTALRGLGVRLVGEVLCQANTALAAGEAFQLIYKKNDGSVVETPTLFVDNLLTYEKKATEALTSQISHIGFNGTDGDIVETNSGNYLVTLGMKDIGKMIGNKRLFKFGEFVAPLTAVKADIAIELAGSLALNQAKDAWIRVVPAALCSSTVVTANDFAGATTTVVQGSRYVTVATSTDYNTNVPLAVGDFVRFGTTVTSAPTVNSPVYKVVELTSATVFKVDRLITDASGNYLAANSATEVIPAASALLGANKWGVRLSGNDANAPFDIGKFGANLIYFSVGISTDFQTTPVRLSQTPFIGNGTYKQLADMDWFLQANGKEKYRIAEFPVNFTPNIVSTDAPTYVYTLTFKDDSTDVIGGRAESLIEVIVAALGATVEGDLDIVFGIFA